MGRSLYHYFNRIVCDEYVLRDEGWVVERVVIEVGVVGGYESGVMEVAVDV